jgi:hypothetical protein
MLQGLFASSRVIGFEFDGWASPEIKGRPQYKETLFFVLHEEWEGGVDRAHAHRTWHSTSSLVHSRTFHYCYLKSP